MNSNDVLRRLRYTFDLDDSTMIKFFSLTDQAVTRAEISDWLKRDDDPELKPISDTQMAAFLNGFIISKRGKQNGKTPEPEKKINNNIMLTKLKIALNLQSDEILALLTLAGLPISKPELSAFFRKPAHKHYRTCKDQILRNFLKGLQMKYHDGLALDMPEPKTPKAETPKTEAPKSKASKPKFPKSGAPKTGTPKAKVPQTKKLKPSSFKWGDTPPEG